MKTGIFSFAAALILLVGGSATPAVADSCSTDTCIVWALNGTGTGGGISYSDGTVVSGTITFDQTLNAWTDTNTISVVSPNWAPDSAGSGSPPAGCLQAPNGVGCTGAVAPGSSWYVDPYMSTSDILFMVNVNPAGVSTLAGSSYFAMFAAQTFNGSDYPGGWPANTGTGNPAAQYNEMLSDLNNGFAGQTYAGTCLDITCSLNDASQPVDNFPHVAAPMDNNQGTDAQLLLSSCPDDGSVCTLGQAGAYFSTIIAAGPPADQGGGGDTTPEPSTFVLLGGSLVAVGYRWRKSSRL